MLSGIHAKRECEPGSRRESRDEAMLVPESPVFFEAFSERPSVQWLNPRVLSPYQRALLVLDGTVTKFIEAWTMDRVRIQCIGQALQTLSEAHDLLEAPAGARVLGRSVVIDGQHSRELHAHAISMIALDRLPADLGKALEIQGAGIGRILNASEVETRREILWVGRERIVGLPPEVVERWDDEFIVRTYRIHSKGHPIMLISERFPFLKTEVGAGD